MQEGILIFKYIFHFYSLYLNSFQCYKGLDTRHECIFKYNLG